MNQRLGPLGTPIDGIRHGDAVLRTVALTTVLSIAMYFGLMVVSGDPGGILNIFIIPVVNTVVAGLLSVLVFLPASAIWEWSGARFGSDAAKRDRSFRFRRAIFFVNVAVVVGLYLLVAGALVFEVPFAEWMATSAFFALFFGGMPGLLGPTAYFFFLVARDRRAP